LKLFAFKIVLRRGRIIFIIEFNPFITDHSLTMYTEKPDVLSDFYDFIKIIYVWLLENYYVDLICVYIILIFTRYSICPNQIRSGHRTCWFFVVESG